MESGVMTRREMLDKASKRPFDRERLETCFQKAISNLEKWHEVTVKCVTSDGSERGFLAVIGTNRWNGEKRCLEYTAKARSLYDGTEGEWILFEKNIYRSEERTEFAKEIVSRWIEQGMKEEWRTV